MQTTQFKYRYIYRQIKANSVVLGTNGWLISDFGYSTRRERHDSYYADHTIWPHKRAAHPVLFKISEEK